jgi:hypothetical protein
MREAQLGVAVGKKGVGKSYTTNKIIDSYVRGNMGSGIMPRRALILDVNDEFSHIKALAIKDIVKFSVHPIVEARRIRPFHDNGKKMTLNDLASTLFIILETYRGGLLLIEDINRYISDSLPNDVIGAICTNRHTSLDIIMHFQSIGRISPKIWQNMNWIRFHKNLDSVKKHQGKFEDKYELLSLVETIVNNEYTNGNKRFYMYANMDEMEFMGKIDPKKLDMAMTQYIEAHYRKLITPMLQVKMNNGKAKYSSDTAIKEQIARMKKLYLPNQNS